MKSKEITEGIDDNDADKLFNVIKYAPAIQQTNQYLDAIDAYITAQGKPDPKTSKLLQQELSSNYSYFKPRIGRTHPTCQHIKKIIRYIK